jgi:hypothetical protein
MSVNAVNDIWRGTSGPRQGFVSVSPNFTNGESTCGHLPNPP